ncbi:MAG: hypothetical protein V2J12_06465 [Gammaproteobacteria bacterium]|jgi:hypothetical protein|nr:hypothetical protein [Gammaproteobacteria bacterium]
MDIWAQNFRRARGSRAASVFTAGFAALLLTACGGGDSGIGLGGGQSPDPVVADFPLFFVQRPLPVDDMGMVEQGDVRELLTVRFGADLYMRDRASVSAPERNLTGDITNGFGDVRDVAVSFDGEKVLFSMRTPIDPNADDEDQPTWNLWEYDIPTDSLRRIFADDITAEEGHDLGGQYLPDGRIVFSSTRQNRAAARLLDEGKPQFAALDEDQEEPAFVLHVMEDDGTNLTQISFNQSHDLFPTVLDNGRILFARWDGFFNLDEIALYHSNPDGTDLELLYGADSHATGTGGANVQFLQPRELQDGRILALLKPFSGTSYGGELIAIDVANYINNTQAATPNQGILTGPAQTPATINEVLTVPGISTGGRYASAWPLWDGSGRILVSWSVCQLELFDPLALPGDTPERVACTEENLQNPLALESPPAYGIWVYNTGDDSQQPVVIAQPGVMFTDVAVAQPRPRQTVIPDADTLGVLDPNLISEDAGILDIRSIYDVDGVDTAIPDIATVADPAQTTADQRRARFLRIYKAVGIPDEETYDFDNAAFGVSRLFGMRELVGYAPIEPDGSVRVKVPADAPLTFEILDRNGRRFGANHRNWLQVRPGEVRQCNGCHERTADFSHGRKDAFDSVYAGAAGNGVAFPNTDPLAFPTVNMGETMAQARTAADPAALNPTLDIVFADVWTFEPDAGRAPDAPFSITYAELTTPAPEARGCEPWTSGCRVLINYPEHIQPLWEAPRPAIDPATQLQVFEFRCVDCHALRNADNEFIDPELRGQLELTSNASAAEALHFVSYRELLFGDNLEEIRDGTVQDVLRDLGNVDINGDPILEPVGVAAPLSAGGANARPAFFNRFAADGPHPNWLNASELRLIAEWLDMGAQYYNNPFDAPED